MSRNANELSAILKSQIENFGKEVRSEEIGNVVTVGDGIALVSGLTNAVYGELLQFESGTMGMVLNLEEDVVGVTLMGSDKNIQDREEVKRTGKVISVPVGDQLIGRVVDALGQDLDGQGKIDSSNSREIFKVAPGVMTREEVNQPLETGIVAIDSMIPIGKGQRELIIGDRQTGKTAIALDTIINQAGKNVKCVYVAIGQKNSTIAQVFEKLKRAGAMEYTTIVAASASEMAPLQYIAPYTGVTIAEEWMANGEDVLIIYDDLSKHAVAYRTLSLLLRRPPGREAFPGDVFYLHSQLLERAARVNKENGGGSITALPIIETQAGDISAYIPTNVISITDGQIFTMSQLFNSGQRPAVDPGFSVSRVGGAAQVKAMKKVAGTLKLELAQYNEMAAFAQFGSDLDSATQKVLDHGKRVLEVLKQGQYSPIQEIDQVIVLLAVKERHTAQVPVEKITEYKESLIKHFNDSAKSLRDELFSTKELSDELYEKISKEVESFTNQKYPKVEEETKEESSETEVKEETTEESSKVEVKEETTEQE